MIAFQSHILILRHMLIIEGSIIYKHRFIAVGANYFYSIFIFYTIGFHIKLLSAMAA